VWSKRVVGSLRLTFQPCGAGQLLGETDSGAGGFRPLGLEMGNKGRLLLRKTNFFLGDYNELIR